MELLGEYIYKIEEDIPPSEIVYQTQQWLNSYEIPLKVVLKSDDNISQKEAFLDEIVDLYKRYGYSLAYEDTQGAFRIQNYSEENIEWLKECLKYKRGLNDTI